MRHVHNSLNMVILTYKADITVHVTKQNQKKKNKKKYHRTQQWLAVKVLTNLCYETCFKKIHRSRANKYAENNIYLNSWTKFPVTWSTVKATAPLTPSRQEPSTCVLEFVLALHLWFLIEFRNIFRCKPVVRSCNVWFFTLRFLRSQKSVKISQTVERFQIP